jgi:uncharacterized protein (DUF2384 family)
LPSAILDPEESLERLEASLNGAIAKLREGLEAAASGSQPSTVDPEYAERFAETARRLSVQLSNELPPQLESDAIAEIRRILINLLDELGRIDRDRPLDTIDSFFVGAEAIRHIVRDALDEHLGRQETDSRPLVDYLHEALPRVSQSDQARLVGISTRHLQRLGKDGGTPPRRLTVVARLVKLLRYAWTPEGVVAWFFRERRELDGHAPIDVLGDPGFEGALLALVRQGRAGHGS